MTRLYVVSEGLSELTFVQDILAPHVQGRRPGLIVVEAPNLRGNSSYGKLKKLIRALLGKPSAEVLVTTMIDLYQLPGDFPGYTLCNKYKDERKRVEELERFFGEDINDRRFIPYLQLHEFEALILTDVSCLGKYYPKSKDALVKLNKSIKRNTDLRRK